MTMPPSTAAESPFWLAYETRVKQVFGNLGPTQLLFVRPFTRPWIETKTAISEEVANFLAYDVANTLLTADNGSPGPTDGFAQELGIYLQSVNKAAILTPGDERQLEVLLGEYEEAKRRFEEESIRAHNKYDNLDPPSQVPFDQWVETGDRAYGRAKEDEKLAWGAYDELYGRTKGIIDSLEEDQGKVANALDPDTSHPGFNMKGQGPAIRGNDIPARFVPSYLVPTLRNSLNSWIGGGGTQQTFFKYKVSDIVSPGTGSGGSDDGIFLEMTTKGLGKFDISPGPWDIGANVKTRYPKRVPDAPDVLNPKFARAFSFLVAYDVQLKVTITDSHKDKVALSGGPDASSVAARGNSDGSDGGYPVILGILCRRL